MQRRTSQSLKEVFTEWVAFWASGGDESVADSNDYYKGLAHGEEAPPFWV